ncbi:HAD-IIB family hydrolase [Patescibacteria group bacterium]
MIIATDLDRTLIPNGFDEYDGSLPLFFDIVEKKKIPLIYVTGRNLDLFEEAKKEYKIKNPDYLIGEVGTVIYKRETPSESIFNLFKKEKMVLDKDWFEHLNKKVGGNWNFGLIKRKLEEIKDIELQEEWKLNNYKISYYLRNLEKEDEVVEQINKIVLLYLGMKANIIFSVDPIKKTGLIDILPQSATKTSALEFLRIRLGASKDDTIYCGDSGNDIIPLTSGYKSIVVKNARDKIKEVVSKINHNLGHPERLYVAKGNDKMNGNYSSGIIEGLLKFGIIEKLK